MGPQHAALTCIWRRCLQGAIDDQLIPSTLQNAYIKSVYTKTSELWGISAGVGGKLAGKIPLAYAHFVQILVDSFLLLAPFSLYSEMGIWSIPAVGILTLFYSGLLDLAKILLHPLGTNEETYDDSVNMDLAVIIRESNAGSVRWMMEGECMPF